MHSATQVADLNSELSNDPCKISLEGQIYQASFCLRNPRKAIHLAHFLSPPGYLPEDGVEDMTILTNIDEHGININLKSRYAQDQIYVSVPFWQLSVLDFLSAVISHNESR